MKLYLLSFGAGVLVGVIYSLINVRSPAPPVIALIGLLGMLAGEQVPALIGQVWRGVPLAVIWMDHVHPHVFGQLPAGKRGGGDVRLAETEPRRDS